MAEQVSQTEKNVFGEGAQPHPVTGMAIETGRGALPPDVQARNIHIPYIEQTQGKKAADAMRRKMGIPTAEEAAAKAKADAEAKAAEEKAKFDAAVEKRAKELLDEVQKSAPQTPLQ